MPGRVFVSGGSGFVGSAVIDELLSRGHTVNALVNRGPVDPRGGRVRSIPGGLFNPGALDEAMRDTTAAIHLVGIIMEKPAKGITFERIHFQGARNAVDAAVRNNVRRYVHMSALGTRADAVSDYHRTKFKAEEYVRASALEWTIFRPSMIHGPKGEFMAMAAKWVRGTAPPFLFMPYFGAGPFGKGGAGKLQPIHVGDVARAFADALEKPATIGEVYPLGGTEVLTWPELHRSIATAMRGRPRWVMPLPAWYAKALTRILPPAMIPFNRDQVIMSQEDNTCDVRKFTDDFGWQPRGFVEPLKEYAATL